MFISDGTATIGGSRTILLRIGLDFNPPIRVIVIFSFLSVTSLLGERFPILFVIKLLLLDEIVKLSLDELFVVHEPY